MAIHSEGIYPTDDEWEALARAIDPTGRTGAWAGRAVDRAFAAGFRRTEVPEPSAEIICTEPGHAHCDRQYTDAEPQGEPSDAPKHRFTEEDIAAATSAHAEHVTGYSMADGGQTYTCRCGWSRIGPDAEAKARTHRMRQALESIIDREVDAEERVAGGVR